MKVPLTAAWKDAPPLACHPIDRHYRHYSQDNLRSRLGWSRFPKAGALPDWSQRWWNRSSQTRLEGSNNRFVEDVNQALIIQLR